MKFILIIFLLTCSLFSQSEFLVNTHTDTTQRAPRIARDAAGNYVIIWKSEHQVTPTSRGDIFMQRYNSNDVKVGTETLVNQQTSGDQERPSLAMNGNGDLVIVWASFVTVENFYDIHARLYKNGQNPSDEFVVNSTRIHTQNNPDVDIRENGEFVVVWDSWFQDGGDRGVYAQRFDANGVKVGNEFRVNTVTAYSQTKPKVRYMSDGRFIVIWESWRQDILTPSGYGLYGKIFDAGGTALTGEIQINTHTHDYQWFGDLDVFDDNSFVVVWCSWEQDGDDGGIYFQRFNENGVKVGNETLANRTTIYYQWLPRVKKLSGKNFALIWSSWKQDGSREGVYTAFFDEQNFRYTFETQVNDYTDWFQWEPDLIATAENEIIAVWSSWEQFGNGNDYDIVAKRISPPSPQGIINPLTYSHLQGTTTTKLIVHVVDSTVVTGHTYEVTFDTTVRIDSAFATIKNINTGDTVVNHFGIDRGLGIFYITPVFEGVAVEIQPVFKMELDVNNSYFANNTFSNLIYTVMQPTAGQRLTAPIDIALVWGRTDTLANGSYAFPSDTGLSLNGIRNVILPFNAINITDNTPVTMLIKENNQTRNFRWDPGEGIVFLTPPPYNVNPFNTQAELLAQKPAGNVIMPSIGDTNYILTQRPLSPNDKFRFVTNKSLIISDIQDQLNNLPESFVLYQNYPNPFNPSTTIKFNLPQQGKVTLSIFNILGQKVATLIDEIKDAGQYKVLFNAASAGTNLASGIYFYNISFDNKQITKKMVYMK